MKIKDIKIRHHDRTVDGTFYMPEGKKQFPVVIFSHGYNGYKTDFDRSARYFAANGTGAFCYTFCGGSMRDQSGFPTTEMTLFTEKEDLEAVIAELKIWDCVATENVYLFGASQGGMVSALAAEEKQADIAGLILLYPAFCIADNWNERFKNSEDIPDQEELWGMTLGRKFFESIRNFNIKEQIGKFGKNVLMMHGAEDQIVPLDYSIRASEWYKNARIEVFQKEGHGFSEDGNRRMEAMALYFLHDCIRKAEATLSPSTN